MNLVKKHSKQIWLRVLKTFLVKSLYQKDPNNLGLSWKYISNMPDNIRIILVKEYLENIKYDEWKIFVKWLKDNDIFEQYCIEFVNQCDINMSPFDKIETFKNEYFCDLLTLTIYWEGTSQGHYYWLSWHEKLRSTYFN